MQRRCLGVTLLLQVIVGVFLLFYLWDFSSNSTPNGAEFEEDDITPPNFQSSTQIRKGGKALVVIGALRSGLGLQLLRALRERGEEALVSLDTLPRQQVQEVVDRLGVEYVELLEVLRPPEGGAPVRGYFNFDSLSKAKGIEGVIYFEEVPQGKCATVPRYCNATAYEYTKQLISELGSLESKPWLLFISSVEVSISLFSPEPKTLKGAWTIDLWGSKTNRRSCTHQGQYLRDQHHHPQAPSSLWI